MKLRSCSSHLGPVLVVALGGFWLGAVPPGPAANPAPPRPVLKVDSSPIGNPGPGGLITSYADIVEPVQKAVVSVYSTKTLRPGLLLGTGGRRGGADGNGLKEEGLGSGVIVSPNGYILTNNHVVEGSDELNVLLTDGRKFPAKILGADDKTDVAVIKIAADNLPVATLADSDKLRVGDIVFAIGNPLDVGQTVTNGIISATRRSNLGLLDNVVGGYENFIQTDAAINMGNSGGALIDAKGRLVGLNSAIISETEGSIGIGFAIPVNLAASIMHSLLENNGRVVRGYLGVGGDTVDDELAESDDLTPAAKAVLTKLPKDTKGVLVINVTANGPGGKAGIKPNDVITAVSEHAIASVQDLRMTVAQMSPNSTVGVKLYRDGQETTIKVSLAELPNNELLPGVTVTTLDPETRDLYTVNNNVAAGLVVVKITNGSPYYGQLLRGVVVMAINKQPVNDVEVARKLLHFGDNELSIYYRRAIQTVTLNVR